MKKQIAAKNTGLKSAAPINDAGRTRSHSLARKAVTAALVAILAFDGVPAPAFAEALAQAGTAGEQIALDAGAGQDQISEDLVQADAVAQDAADDVVQGSEAPEAEPVAIAEGDEVTDDASASNDAAERAATVAAELREQVGAEATDDVLVRRAYERFANGCEVVDAGDERAGDELAALAGEPSGSVGIARAMVLVLRELGVEVVEVVSADGTATWNMVRLADGAWYHVDAAAAARARAEAPDHEEAVAGTEWLLRSDEAVAQMDQARVPWQVAEAEDGELPASDAPIAERDFAEDGEEDAPVEDDVLVEEEQPAEEDVLAEDAAAEEDVLAEDEQPAEEAAAEEDALVADEVLAEEQPAEEAAAEEAAAEELAAEEPAAPAKKSTPAATPNPDDALEAQSFIDELFVTASCSNKTYTGKAIKPNPTVELLGVRLTKGTDYTLSYPSANYVNVGKKTIVVKGKGIYTFKRTVSFSITKRSLSGATVQAIGNKTYTGKAIKPSPTVKVAGRTLKKGTDYTLSYKNNTKVGTATVVITGKGNYKGKTTRTFKIVKATKSVKNAKVTGYKSSYTYTASAIKPTVKVKVGSTTLKKGTHYTVTYKNNTKVGTATIVIKGKGSYGGTKKVTFKIAKRSVAGATVSNIGTQAYTGAAVKPSPTVKVNGRTLKKGTDYKLSYKNNTAIGTATVVITGKGNYKDSTKKNFKIARASYYTMRRDNWSFENFADIVPLKYCTELYGQSQGQVLYNTRPGEGGNCFGMAASTEAIRKYSYPAAKTFHSGSTYASNLYQAGMGWTSTGNGLTAKDNVMKAHITQYEAGLSAENDRNEENYAGLVSATRTSIKGGTPIVICLYKRDAYGNYYNGHAVMPVSILSDDAQSTKIAIYDSNLPTEAQTLTLYKSNGSYTKSFSYTGDRWGWGLNTLSWETPADDMRELYTSTHTLAPWVGSGASGRYTLCALSDDMTAIVGGKEYDLSEGVSSDDGRVVAVREVGGVEEGGMHLYWIRDDAGELTFANIDEDATIIVAAKTGGVEATVEAGAEVTMDVRNYDDNAVEVAGDEGDEFSVRFFDDDNRGGLDEVTVSGTVEDGQTVEATGDADEVVVTGAQDVVEQ